MTEKIWKSEVSAISNFDAAVARHAAFVREHVAHMARVEADRKNGIKGLAKHQPYPAPIAHPVVARAVDRDGNANYKIEDDGPTPEQELARKKTELIFSLSVAEKSASEAIWPLGKQRRDILRQSDIRKADEARALDIINRRGVIAKAILGPKDPASVAAEVETSRPADDTAFLKDREQLWQKISAVQRIAAQAHADIEDLTVTTIKSWKNPEFT